MTTNATVIQKTEVITTGTGSAHQQTLQGYLKKQSPSIGHNWQKRYFVLLPDNRNIAYYKQTDDVRDVSLRKGTIHITDIKAVEFREGTEFHLVCSDRTYNLRANDVFEKKLWVNTIRAIREALIDAHDSNYDVERTNKHVGEAVSKTMKRHHEHRHHHDKNHHSGLDALANDIIEEKTLTNHNGVITETSTLSMRKAPDASHREVMKTEFNREGMIETAHPYSETKAMLSGDYPIETVSVPSTSVSMESSKLADVYNFFADCTSSDVDSSYRMREFIVIEKVIGEEGKDKTYSFKAPRDSEVNIKFTKIAKGQDLITAPVDSTAYSQGYPMGESVNDPVRLAEVFKASQSSTVMDKQISNDFMAQQGPTKYGESVPQQFVSSELRTDI